MESERGDAQPDDAEAQLRSHEDMRAKVEQREPSRAYASLMVWSALATSAYVGVFLFAASGRVLNDETTDANSSVTPMLLIFGILVFLSLLNGARERFGIRRKPAPRYWIFGALVLAGFMTLSTLSIMKVAYPWWLNLIVPAVLFVAMAVDPIRQLLSETKDPDGGRWVNDPLSRPARRNTALIGVAVGLLAATSNQLPWFSILFLVIMVAFMVLMIALSAPWGITRTGYEWGPLHWGAFGVTLGVVFLLALLLARTTVVTTPLAVTAGIFVFAVMLGASLLPRNPGR